MKTKISVPFEQIPAELYKELLALGDDRLNFEKCGTNLHVEYNKIRYFVEILILHRVMLRYLDESVAMMPYWQDEISLDTFVEMCLAGGAPQVNAHDDAGCRGLALVAANAYNARHGNAPVPARAALRNIE